MVSARQNQLELDFVIALEPGEGVRSYVIGFDVVPLDFFQNLVGPVELFVLDIKNGVHEVFALKRAEAILPAKSCEDGAVSECGLAVEIDLGGPPRLGAVFEFGPDGVEVVAGTLCAESREVFHLKTAGLLKVVVIGDEIGAFLSASRCTQKYAEHGCSDKQAIQQLVSLASNAIDTECTHTRPCAEPWAEPWGMRVTNSSCNSVASKSTLASVLERVDWCPVLPRKFV